jgi:HSP20 family molecular chaperone IbpA
MPLPSVVDEIDRLFDELIRRPWGGASRQLVPATVREVEDGWIVEVPVEGLSANDLNVEVHHQQITVSGHRRSKREHRRGETGWTSAQQETSLYRTIPLPTDADPDTVEAKIEGSTLALHIRRRRR